MRLDLRRFFRWTGVFILFVAAGLLSSSLKNLHEAGIWNLLQGRVFDLGAVLPESGLPGTILSGIFSYDQAPTVGQIVVYLGFLAVALTLFLWPTGSVDRRPAAVSARRNPNV